MYDSFRKPSTYWRQTVWSPTTKPRIHVYTVSKYICIYSSFNYPISSTIQQWFEVTWVTSIKMTDPLHSNHHANLVSLWKHNPIKQKSTLVKYLVLKLFPPFPSCPPSHKEHLHSPTVTQALRRCTSELVYNVAVPGFSGKFLTMITLPPTEVSACRNLPFVRHAKSAKLLHS